MSLQFIALLLCLSFLALSRGRRLTPSERVHLLEAHNWLRGNLPGLDARGEILPRAADMNLLEWDEDLEAIAQDWADRCTNTFGYRECPSYRIWREKVSHTFELANLGQNILVYKKNLTGLDVDISSALNKTYSMLQYYDHRHRNCTTHPAVCDSFTQIVWSSTRKLGCAMGSSCNYLVCNYHPQGNEVQFTQETGWQKKNFAKAGDPCTKCSTGNGWCWNNLCVSNLTSDEGRNSACAITSCEEEGTVEDCTCRCPQHRNGNRCEQLCRNDVTCSRMGFSACSNLYFYESCPLMCKRCSEKGRSTQDWWQASQAEEGEEEGRTAP